MTIQDVYKTVNAVLSRRTNDMTKIKMKCWVYHSESRVRNGNEPFKFSDFTHALGKDFYLEYLKFDFIDCSDIGGKDQAVNVIERWFS